MTHSQSVDTAYLADSVIKPIILLDSARVEHYQEEVRSKSFLLEENKPTALDIQQLKLSSGNAFAFFLLMVMLIILTYVKIAFGKEVEELFQSFTNSNLALQIFRTQSSEISFSSFLLHANFIVAISLYVQFLLVNYFRVTVIKSFYSTLALIFLFTFFYLSKLIALKFIGAVFQVKDECNEYAFDFSTQCKMVGL